MTKPTMIALVLALTGLGLAGCETAEQKFIAAGKTPISGPEIKRLWASGATIRGVHEAWTEFTIRHFPDGRAKIDYTTLNSTGSDKGIWRVKGGKSCKKWDNILDGVERCWTIYKIGENKYQSFREGSAGAKWSVIK